MHERAKLREAEYFFQRMVTSVEDHVAFQYELSAFLSAARSVLQYAYDEARSKAGGQQWYESQVTGNLVLKFFKGKRDLNIHAEPVRPARHIDVSIEEHIRVSDSIRIEIQNADGTIEVREGKGEVPPQVRPREVVNHTSTRYVFTDWSGPEDVLTLSGQYLAALECLVKAGASHGVIAG